MNCDITQQKCSKHYPRMVFFMVIMFFMGVVIVFQHSKMKEMEKGRIEAYRDLYTETSDRVEELELLVVECFKRLP